MIHHLTQQIAHVHVVEADPANFHVLVFVLPLIMKSYHKTYRIPEI
jgi:hypothetical protein